MKATKIEARPEIPRDDFMVGALLSGRVQKLSKQKPSIFDHLERPREELGVM